MDDDSDPVRPVFCLSYWRGDQSTAGQEKNAACDLRERDPGQVDGLAPYCGRTGCRRVPGHVQDDGDASALPPSGRPRGGDQKTRTGEHPRAVEIPACRCGGKGRYPGDRVHGAAAGIPAGLCPEHAPKRHRRDHQRAARPHGRDGRNAGGDPGLPHGNAAGRRQHLYGGAGLPGAHERTREGAWEQHPFHVAGGP